MRLEYRIGAWTPALVAVVCLSVAGGPIGDLQAQPCELPDDGTGTVNLPPAGCGYVSPQDLHIMIEGLPAGTTINVSAEHSKFFNVVHTPDPTGGEFEDFDSILFLDMEGTGSLAGFNRFIQIPIQCRVHTDPRPATDPQTFPTEMLSLQGEISGDPDFNFLRVTAGTDLSLPSPGQTTLTRLPNGNFNVDSFFDITYKIDFVGADKSALEGMSGSTLADVKMQGGEATAPQCVVADNGSGTVNLPPPGCGYVSPQDLHIMIDGLPPGTTIEIAPEHSRFFNAAVTPGGSLGGEIETFDSFLELDMRGTGSLSGFNRLISVPIACEVHTGPRTPGAAHQSFPNEMVQLEGGIFGDPDFEELRVTGGSQFGLPSPGSTQLTRLGPPGSDFNVDSFFDITYQIEFIGDGSLAGMGGLTQAQVRMDSGQKVPQRNPCEVPANAAGTVDLPPQGCAYLSPNEVHMIIEGLPAGTEINIGIEHLQFFNVQTQPGGIFGPDGEIEQFQSQLILSMNGTGELQGFQRQLSVQAGCEVHTGPREAGRPVQQFPNEMVQLQGQLSGDPDPDFEHLQIVAGGIFGLPSPGQTTLTEVAGTLRGGARFAVDSFFDIEYMINFQGAAGGPFEGMSGNTRGSTRMATGNTALSVEPVTPANATRLLTPRPNPFNPTSRIPFVLEAAGRVELTVYDLAGRAVRLLLAERRDAGRHDVVWDGRDDQGRILGTGGYFYELRVDGVVVDTRKATMLK